MNHARFESGEEAISLAIMQPYFLPYIGYFQLLAGTDKIVLYDNIEYTKKGWINRNRRLQNGTDTLFSLPLKKDSDFLDVVQREISADFDPSTMLNQFKGSYAKAPQMREFWPTLERILRHEDRNLFRYILHSIREIAGYIGIPTEIVISSDVAIDHGLKSQDKVIAICRALRAQTYINPIGGTDLYSRDDFAEGGIDLRFLKPKPIEYEQFGNDFVPWLSIVDVLMFNDRETVRDFVFSQYELI